MVSKQSLHKFDYDKSNMIHWSRNTINFSIKASGVLKFIWFQSITPRQSDAQQVKLHFKNQWYWVHSLALRIFFHQGVQWRYRWVVHWFSRVKSLYLPWWHGLSSSDAGYQCVWFYNAHMYCKQSWWHSHCHIGEGLGSKCNHSPLEIVAFKVVVHNNYRLQHTLLQPWIGQRNFISWKTNTLETYQEIGKFWMCSSNLLCTRCSPHQNSQWAQRVHP
jgi:hypothetical protein